MTEILNQFRDDDQPPSTVDVSRAVRAGRRRRRFRTALVAGGVAIGLAVAGAAAPTLLSAQPGPGPQPPADPSCGSPEPARPSMPTWQEFDPLVSEIDASGVAGYHVKITGAARYWQLAHLEANSAGQEGAEPEMVIVVLFACGGEPHVFDVAQDQAVPLDPAAGEPAGPVNGEPAYWLPADSQLPGGTVAPGLAWQWTTGAWAVVFVEPDDLDDPDVDLARLRGVAAQVAPQLEFGVGTPVTAPFSLPVPDGTHPALTVTGWGDPGGNLATAFSIGFSVDGAAEPAHPFVREYLPSLLVDAYAFAEVDDLPDTATAYSEDLGYPAYQDVSQDAGRQVDKLLVFDVSGFGLTITPVDLPGASTRSERLSRAADIFRTITIYSGAASSVVPWGEPIAS